MLRWLLAILAAYIIYRMFRNDIRAKSERKRLDETSRRQTGEMARDPICGTFVDLADAISVRQGDKRYFFCSYDCRDAFLQRLHGGESAESIQAAGPNPETKPEASQSGSSEP